MRKIYCPLMALTLMLALSACQEDQKKVDPDQLPDSAICLTIGGDTAVTKAGGQSIDLSEESGIDGFTMTEEITSLDDLYFTPATKGTPIFSENIASVYGKVAVTPYVEAGKTWPSNTNADKDVVFTPSGKNTWAYDYAGNDFPSNGLLMFVKAPTDDASAENIVYNYSNGSIAFDYTSPTSSTTGQDAVAQKDILFSSRHISKARGDENTILLYHALTGVKFKIGAKTDKHLEIVSIDKVTFTNLKNEGHCVITPDYTDYPGSGTNPGFDEVNGGTVTGKSSTAAVWSDLTGKASFSQAFAAGDQKVDFSETSDYPASITGPNKKAATDNVMDSKATKTFMFIPQELVGADVDVIIEYQYKDGNMGPYKGTVTIKDFGKKMAGTKTSYKWQAGELRTYTITVGDRVAVDIDDDVNGTSHKKSNVEIMNTGTALAYMRVAVVGNWFYIPLDGGDDTPVSITPCNNLTSHKTAINSKWVEGADGYFYYLYPVPGGSTILPANTLFDEVTFSAEYGENSKPYANCELRISLAVQAVRASQVATAWGNTTLVKDQAYTVASKLKTEPID